VISIKVLVSLHVKIRRENVRNNLDIVCGAMRCGSIAHRGRNDLVSFACGGWPGRVGL
jgi:hypothetical protein